MADRRSIAILPLDDRPPNYEYPSLLTEAAGLHALLPPKEWLGNPWRSGDIARLSKWLEEVTPHADALIVALDTLGYGGLVNSRRVPESAGTVLARLNLLRRFKRERRSLSILGYSVLMRISRHNTAEEEKAYWESYGERIFRISYLEDRLSMLAGEPGDQDRLASLTAKVPPEILQDYLRGRARNHAINRAMVEWAANGLFDYLIIPQDDTVEYGWNIGERRRLQLLVNRLGVADRVSIYPGADEVDMLLLARHVATRAGFRPRVWPRYSGVNANRTVTAYEDRPMEEMIKAHLGPLNGVLATSSEDADVSLYVNAPAEIQGAGYYQYPLTLVDDDFEGMEPRVTEAILAARQHPEARDTLRELHSVDRNVEEFAHCLAQDVDAQHTCAVVDVAYVNGSDLALCIALCRHVKIAQLAAYGGWNTAGNTLGTVLAQAVIRHLQKTTGAGHAALAAHAKFLFVRFVDDYLYQGIVRSQATLEALPPLGVEPRMSDLGQSTEPVQDVVREQLAAKADRLAADHFQGHIVTAKDASIQIGRIGIRDIRLPWHRLFEMGCDVELIA